MQHLHTHPIVEKVRTLGLGKIAVTAATSSILAPVISDEFPTTRFHYLLIQSILTCTVFVWLGYFFEDVALGPALQLFGITGLLLWSSLTMAAFISFLMPLGCWLVAFLFCSPLLDIIIHPCRGAPAVLLVHPPAHVVEVV